MAIYLAGTKNSPEPLYTELGFTHVAGLQAIAQPSEFPVREVQFNTRESARAEFTSFRLVCLKHVGHIFTTQAHLRYKIKDGIAKSRVFPVQDPCDPWFIGRMKQDMFMPQVTVRKPLDRTTQFPVLTVLFPPALYFAQFAWRKGRFQVGVSV